MPVTPTPRDPLFRYFNPNDPHEAALEVESAGAPDYLFLGHTHLPCDVRSSLTRIVNPGSVGQPKDRNPGAAYAVWSDGQILFRRTDYNIEEVRRSFASSGLHHHDVWTLLAVLRSGGQLPEDR